MAVGCGGAPTAVVPPAPGNTVATAVVATIPAIDVTTLRTADDLAQVPRAARLQADAQLRWRQGAPPDADVLGDAQYLTGTVWPVLDATDTDVRIAVDGDDAVIGVWLARGGLEPAIIEEVTPTRGGAALPVTLRPGAAIAVEPDGTTISLVHDAIDLRADVPAAAIGDVFTRVASPAFTSTGYIDPYVDIRASADPAAPPFARLHEVLNVVFGETRGALRAFTYVDDYVSLRGYVPAAATSDQMGGFGYGGGRGPGGSHTLELDVPAGACLLSSDGEEVVGVTTAPRTRLVRPSATARHWEMLLAVPWGTAEPLVEDLDATGDVARTRVRMCDGAGAR